MTVSAAESPAIAAEVVMPNEKRVHAQLRPPGADRAHCCGVAGLRWSDIDGLN
jgi:hypothetical protein